MCTKLKFFKKLTSPNKRTQLHRTKPAAPPLELIIFLSLYFLQLYSRKKPTPRAINYSRLSRHHLYKHTSSSSHKTRHTETKHLYDYSFKALVLSLPFAHQEPHRLRGKWNSGTTRLAEEEEEEEVVLACAHTSAIYLLFPYVSPSLFSRGTSSLRRRRRRIRVGVNPCSSEVTADLFSA